jgi:hypothetical protein
MEMGEQHDFLKNGLSPQNLENSFGRYRQKNITRKNKKHIIVQSVWVQIFIHSIMINVWIF